MSLVSNLRAFLSFSVYRSMWFDPYSVISRAFWSRHWGDEYAWERVEMSLPCLILKTVDQIQQVRWAQHYGILGVVTSDNWDIRNLPESGGVIAELGTRSHIWEATMFWESFSWNSRRVWSRAWMWGEVKVNVHMRWNTGNWRMEGEKGMANRHYPGLERTLNVTFFMMMIIL